MTNGKKKPGLAPEMAVCAPRTPKASHIDRAKTALEINPANHPTSHQIAMAAAARPVSPEHIAIMTTKYWRAHGVDLGVGFLDNPPRALRTKILAHMNAWGDGANIRFRESSDSPQVRIARGTGGYWSYLGTDILLIDQDEQTMNLEGFTMATPDSEFNRVVRHETGHTLGCPHEHMRADLIALIDREKAIEYFSRTQGWSEDMVIQQVLTPLDERTLQGTDKADQQSIMCYEIPGTLTVSGERIVGGADIDESDRDFIRLIYPPSAAPAAAAPMTATPAKAAMQAMAAAVAKATKGAAAPARADASAHGLVELHIEPGIRVLLNRPVGRSTLDRLAGLLC